jgi:DNA-binding transcriptional LysR family regulator
MIVMSDDGTGQMPPLDLSDLFYFAALAQDGSMTATAKRLFITQPALSRWTARLEEALGGRFFRRSGQGVVLTDFGDLLLPLG